MDELVGEDILTTIYSEPQIVEFDGTPILFMQWINANNYSDSVNLLKTA